MREMTPDDATCLSEGAFRELCGTGAVRLEGRAVVLEAPIKVNANETLSIVGPGSIVGSGHSLFQVGGRAQPFGLRLRRLALRHVGSPARRAERSLGACVFALGKGVVDAEDCDLRSECGFAVWLKQRAACRLRNCRLAAARAAVAVFNFSAVRLHACDVADAHPHGICARGCARVDVEASTIRNAGVRAVYAYMSPKVTLTDVVVSGTRDPTAAAVQVEALRPGDAATLALDGLRLDANAGRGVAVAGRVDVTQAAAPVLVHRAAATGRYAFGEGRPRNPCM